MAQELPARPKRRQGIDAAVRPEAPILESEKHVEIARVDIADRNRQSPDAVRRREGPQQTIATIENNGGGVPRALEARWCCPARRQLECEKWGEDQQGGCQRAERTTTNDGAAGLRLRRLTAAPGRLTRGWRLPRVSPSR